MRIAAFIFSCFLAFSGVTLGQTEIIHSDSGFQLIRNGEPYYVNGAGGTTQLDVLQEIGGNSIRTWGTENAQEILDEAYSRGISVCLDSIYNILNHCIWASNRRC